jgi:hypothetical protein
VPQVIDIEDVADIVHNPRLAAAAAATTTATSYNNNNNNSNNNNHYQENNIHHGSNIISGHNGSQSNNNVNGNTNNSIGGIADECHNDINKNNNSNNVCNIGNKVMNDNNDNINNNKDDTSQNRRPSFTAHLHGHGNNDAANVGSDMVSLLSSPSRPADGDLLAAAAANNDDNLDDITVISNDNDISVNSSSLHNNISHTGHGHVSGGLLDAHSHSHSQHHHSSASDAAPLLDSRLLPAGMLAGTRPRALSSAPFSSQTEYSNSELFDDQSSVTLFDETTPTTATIQSSTSISMVPTTTTNNNEVPQGHRHVHGHTNKINDDIGNVVSLSHQASVSSSSADDLPSSNTVNRFVYS